MIQIDLNILLNIVERLYETYKVCGKNRSTDKFNHSK